MQQQCLRIGMLGAGRRGKEHLRSIAALPDLYELAAVCDVSAAAGAAAAPAGVRVYSSVRDFLASEKLDLVLITTPRETHHIVVKVVAEYGVNMLIETPLATTRAMMDVIEEVAANSNLRIEVGENMWRRPAERLNQQAIDAGLVGSVVRVTSYYGPAGGDSCYHMMSLMRHYAGADCEEVRALSQDYDLTGARSETWIQGFLRYGSGVTGSITYTSDWVSPLRRGHPRLFTVEGTKGFIVTGDCSGHMLRHVQDGVARDFPKRIETAVVDGREQLVRLYYETDSVLEYRNPFLGRAADDGDPRKLYDEVARASELESIHRAITTGAPPDYSVAKARRDMELSILLTESGRRREPLAARSDALGPETEWERRQHDEFRQTYGADPIADIERLIQSADWLGASPGGAT